MTWFRLAAVVAIACVLGCTSGRSKQNVHGQSGGAGNQTSGSGAASQVAGGAQSSAGGTQSLASTASAGGAQASASASSGGSADSGFGGSATAGGGGELGEGTAGAGASQAGWDLPRANAPFDYQLGGGYTPPDGVRIVTRDREDAPAAGLYNICYVNGFQTQPQDNQRWLDDHPELIVHDANGEPVFDEDWGEYLFDTSSTEKQLALVDSVADWIAGCATSGFDAVEIDNLDSYSRSGGRLSENDNVSFMARLSELAHEQGLAIGQKNAAELVPRARELGTDFAVAEECNRYDECGAYQQHYGDLVFVIEYRQQDFDQGCTAFPELSIVLRDVELVTPRSADYVFDGC